jgi:uncharacterized glyoxalase superfamily protein PhnB
MLSNRSVPPCTVIPVLFYPDVTEAADWLCAAFGFTVRLRIGNHRIQLRVSSGNEARSDDGYLVIAEGNAVVDIAHLVMIRVPDAHQHCERARQHGADILVTPTDHVYGERQYQARDYAGHRWTFTQSIADVAPEQWGGTAVDL